MKNDIMAVLLELGFRFDHPFPYTAPCLVLVIILGVTDLSISKQR
jgi:hypothetical protein